jgi:hypothetical protein
VWCKGDVCLSPPSAEGFHWLLAFRCDAFYFQDSLWSLLLSLDSNAMGFKFELWYGVAWALQCCGGWMCFYRPVEPHRCTFPARKGICQLLWLSWMPARPSRFVCWGADHEC